MYMCVCVSVWEGACECVMCVDSFTSALTCRQQAAVRQVRHARHLTDTLRESHQTTHVVWVPTSDQMVVGGG